jgi:hypothetical protein
MIKKTSFLFLGCIWAGSVLLAQDFPYRLKIKQQAYQELTSPHSLTKGELMWDLESYRIPLAMDFELLGTQVHQLFFLNSGQLITSREQKTNILLISDATFIDRGILTGTAESQIGYQLEGTEGERILKIEWKNMGFSEEVDNLETSTDYANYQLWLYEGSNNMEFHFGSNNINHDEMYYLLGRITIGIIEGFDLDSEEFSKLWYLSGIETSPTLKNVDYDHQDSVNQVLSDDPLKGYVYQFIRNDVGINKAKPPAFKVIFNDEVEQIKIVHLTTSNQNMEFKIYQLDGKLRMSGTLTKNNVIDISQLPSAAYILHLKNTNHPMFKQIFTKHL